MARCGVRYRWNIGMGLRKGYWRGCWLKRCEWLPCLFFFFFFFFASSSQFVHPTHISISHLPHLPPNPTPPPLLHSKIVRHSLARSIASITDLELPVPQPQWPELLPFLSTHSQSPTPSHREISIFTLFIVLDCIHDAFDSPANQNNGGGPFWEMFGLFGRALVDPESEDVRVDALRALGKMAEYIEIDQKELIVSLWARAKVFLFRGWGWRGGGGGRAIH